MSIWINWLIDIQIWYSAQLRLFAFFVFSPEFWAKYSALEVMIDVRDILTDRNLHHLVVNIYCPTPIFIAWNNWLPCGKHLHCLHSWFLGQKSSALGENSSHSQPAEGTRRYIKERAVCRSYKEIYKGESSLQKLQGGYIKEKAACRSDKGI